MKHTNLNKAIDNCFGPFVPDNIKKAIFLAAEKDAISESGITENDMDWLIIKFNEIFKKKSRIMSKAVSRKYNAIFKTFSKEEIEAAMRTASKDDFHKATMPPYKHLTLEYFSRVDKMDKWISASTSQVSIKEDSGFVLPKFNVKG